MKIGDVIDYKLNGPPRRCEVVDVQHVELGILDIKTGVRHNGTRFKLKELSSGSQFWSVLFRDADT